ncbi:MAG: hypothetical protein OXU62_10165 [Gammaproteobacteria bacterium]|nr:hypothetical protein [Gammaproteobacteria bacterium]
MRARAGGNADGDGGRRWWGGGDGGVRRRWGRRWAVAATVGGDGGRRSRAAAFDGLRFLPESFDARLTGIYSRGIPPPTASFPCNRPSKNSSGASPI